MVVCYCLIVIVSIIEIIIIIVMFRLLLFPLSNIV